MKVSIKVSASKLATAAAAVAEWSLDYSARLGTTSYNPDQSLTLAGNILTYTGQRHPFFQDGALNVVIDALDVFYKDAKIQGYQTSDSRLNWYETLDGYLETRGTLAEITAVIVSNMTEGYTSAQALGRFDRNPALAEIYPLLNATPAVLNASVNAETARLVRKIQSALAR